MGRRLDETAAIFNISHLKTIRKWKATYETEGMMPWNQRKRGVYP